MKKVSLPRVTPKTFIVLAIVASFGAGAIASRFVFIPQKTQKSQDCYPREKLYVDNVYQDEEIKSIILEQLGVHENNIQGLELKFVDNLEKTEDTEGVYSKGYSRDCVAQEAPKISIKTGLPERYKLITIAHEFVHHYYSRPWFRNIQVGTEQELILLYHKNPKVRERMDKYYTANGKLKLTELFAVACTEFPDKELTKDLVYYCNQALPKRDVLGLN